MPIVWPVCVRLVADAVDGGPGESRVRDTPADNSTGRGGMDSDVQARIDGLEAELQRLRAEVVAARADEQTSRREVFKKLVVAGAGAAVGAVALGGGRADATQGAFMILGVGQSAANMTYLGNGTFSNFATGVLTSEKTLFWADNRTSTLDNGYGVRGDGHGTDGVGVHGHSDFAGIGVLADGTGVGLMADGVRAAAQLVQNGGSPLARADAHTQGELVYDTDGNLWFCVASGTPGTWRQLSGPADSGQLHLLTGPVRVYDSRPGATNDGPLASGQQRIISLAAAVPTGATGAMFSLTLDATNSSGFLAVFKNGIPWPGNSNVNWYASGQIVAVTTVSAVDATAKVIVFAGGPGSTQFIIDVIGYYA